MSQRSPSEPTSDTAATATQGNPMTFVFDAKIFVQDGYETAPGDWSPKHAQEIALMRPQYPELAHWGDSAFGHAFFDYSQDVYLVTWAEWAAPHREESFLDYCCWRQTRGRYDEGFDFEALAQANDWRPVR